MSDHEDGGDDNGVVESPDVHVTPIVKLKLVELPTGEDEEETILETYVWLPRVRSCRTTRTPTSLSYSLLTRKMTFSTLSLFSTHIALSSPPDYGDRM
jgi:hypothetical protein